MTYQRYLLLFLITLMTACAALEDQTEPFRRPYHGIDNFGPDRNTGILPKADVSEVWLGRIKQPNGEYIAEDGTYEVMIGSRGECVYAFRINPRTGRMVSWRLASKGDPKSCE